MFLDITPTRIEHLLIGKHWPVESGLLERIRVGQHDPSTVRVVLDVGRIDRVTAFTLRDPNRVVIDVMATERTRTTAVANPDIPDPPADGTAKPPNGAELETKSRYRPNPPAAETIR